jgi:hypothetical protein
MTLQSLQKTIFVLKIKFRIAPRLDLLFGY